MLQQRADGPDGNRESSRDVLELGVVGEGQVSLGHADGQVGESLTSVGSNLLDSELGKLDLSGTVHPDRSRRRRVSAGC